MSVTRRLFVFAPAALWAAGLAAQESDAFYARINALSGFEMRAYAFDPGLSVTRASQWHVPLAFVTPLNQRLSVDVSTSYASSTQETTGGTETITGFTDTQLRFLYTMQPDRLIASLVFNLPTGQRSVSESEFAVTGAVGSNFLSFPVSGLGTAVGVTGGLAYAARAGSWNVGLAGSMRYLGPYEPFSDVVATYTPGLEGRLRAGVDRLLGARTRFLVGVTASTYSVDEFAAQARAFRRPTTRPARDSLRTWPSCMSRAQRPSRWQRGTTTASPAAVTIRRRRRRRKTCSTSSYELVYAPGRTCR